MSESSRHTDTTVPAPRPPGDPEAWYAPDVHRQEAVHPGVVVTVRGTHEPFSYETREPSLSRGGRSALNAVETYFSDASVERPLTRDGAAERMAEGFAPKYDRAVDRLTDLTPTMRRRLEYHALSRVTCLGELTPHALDGGVEMAEERDGEVVVHTDDFAPVRTGLHDAAFTDRFANERLARYTVPFLDFEVPVVLYREHVLGSDPFTTKYAVREPDLLPGDHERIEECKERIWEGRVDGVVTDDDRAAFVRERAERILARRLTADGTRAWLDATRYRLRSVLADYDLAVPPVDDQYAPDRLDDLVYYVLRDYVGYGQLTVPIRDGRLEDVEANRVGERVKVVPRGVDERVPTNLAFDDEAAFVNVVTQLAAADGVEVNASTPSAKVNLQPEGIDETIRCAVALPTISEGGPHISIRKQSRDPLTPVDLVRAGSLPTELVTLLWLLYEHHGVVLFAGPTGVGKTTLLNAHVPFIPYDDRPVSIDEGSREVRLPHETGVSLQTRDHESAYKQVSMADLMTETNYLNPDVEIIAEINTPASFETFGEVLATGHGVLGTTHAEDVRKLVNRVIEQGLPPHLLAELDLVVFPRRNDGERYVGEVVELVDEDERGGSHADERGSGHADGVVERPGATVHYNTVFERTTDGDFDVRFGPDATGRSRTVRRIADRTDRTVAAVESEFREKHRYVQYLVREGVDDVDDLFEFLADLRANEAATVERAAATRENAEGATSAVTDGGSTDTGGHEHAESERGGDDGGE
ncbi:type II/IV secretion system ATPase subunit [Halomarina oriensis]|uniref:Secretion system protein n=1 Tax=Halomarina oriensis TaxID=671145 RepID=A0A6B0GRZ2_9EURY|nr:type II/IV secretion system ATPase subunit [Halomarina oriensis]MWG36921.1 secretion system protein [Halomarina oriensis]